jgi:hypothetical protein
MFRVLPLIPLAARNIMSVIIIIYASLKLYITLSFHFNATLLVTQLVSTGVLVLEGQG